MYHLDVLHHLDSGGQWKAVQAERLGPHQDAPAEHSEFRDDRRAGQDAPAEHSEFPDDRPADQDAPAEHSEFPDDRRAGQDAPACRRAVQVDCRDDPVSRVPVACRPHTGGVIQT